MCGTDPYEVEVGEGPWKAKGETPTHHDAKIGEENNRDESKHYRTNLLIWVFYFSFYFQLSVGLISDHIQKNECQRQEATCWSKVETNVGQKLLFY